MKKELYIKLPTEPYLRGTILGKYTQKYLKIRIASVAKIRKKKRISISFLRYRAGVFRDILRDICPHWLEEIKGIAEGSGISEEEIILMNCLPSGFYSEDSQRNNCTSFIIVKDTKNHLFKIRDERNHIQQFFIYSSGDLLFHIGRDIGNIGAAHILRSDGIGFANNTGSQTDFVDDEVKFNDVHILRYLAENAKNIEDIPEVFSHLARKGVAGGGGKNKGAIFLCVNKDRGLILETAGNQYNVSWVKKGSYVVSNHFLSKEAKRWESGIPKKNTVLRKKRMEELLAKYKSSISIFDVFAICRDRKYHPHALCNDDKKHWWMTISAQLHVIDKKDKRNSMNYVCCGNTRNSMFLPVPLDFEENFVPLLSGDFYKRANRLYRKYGCSSHIKKEMERFEKRHLSSPYKNLKDVYFKAYKFLSKF